MKRVLLTGLGCLSLIVVVMVIAFTFAPTSFDYTNEVRIERPVEQTWAVFTDGSRMGEWIHGIERVENVSGEHLEVGSQWKLVMVEGGRDIEMVETVTACEPPSVFSFDMDNPWFLGQHAITLRPEDGGAATVLTAKNTVAGKGAFKRFLLWIGREGITAQGQHAYEHLKEIVEAEPQPEATGTQPT
ncbi:MAG: SRPBCC family protein [Acidobacteriota bacterium]